MAEESGYQSLKSDGTDLGSIEAIWIKTLPVSVRSADSLLPHIRSRCLVEDRPIEGDK
jgi:hypothetical protein